MSKLYIWLLLSIPFALLLAGFIARVGYERFKRKRRSDWLEAVESYSAYNSYVDPSLLEIEKELRQLRALPQPPADWTHYNKTATAKYNLDQRKADLRSARNRILERTRRGLEFEHRMARVATKSRTDVLATRYEKAARLFNASPAKIQTRRLGDGFEVYDFIADTTTEYATQLLADAREGDRTGFFVLMDLVRYYVYGDRSFSGDYYKQTGTHFSYPDDWNDLVIRFMKNPSLGDFKNIRTDAAAGEVRLMAADALRSGSLLDAQIVLAFCDAAKWRLEVGDVLTAELAKLVTQLQAANQSVFS